MTYISLYRKYRSANFETLVGQETVVQTLKNAVSNHRISHAYLFSGPRGTGKTSTARIFAKMLECEKGPTTHPCGICFACTGITQGTLVDVLEIDAASNTSVENIREIRERVNFFPAMARMKIYIIDEVHMLSTSAFNALLKTLEEPPENVVFILATTNPQKLPATVISRCQKLDFTRIPLDQIMARLSFIATSESVAIDTASLRLMAKKSEGCMRDAISILDQVISYSPTQIVIEDVLAVLGVVNQEELYLLIHAILYNQPIIVSETLEHMAFSGKSAQSILKDIIDYCRAMLLVKTGHQHRLDYADDDIKKIQSLVSKLEISQLLLLLKTLSETMNAIRYSEDAQIILEVELLALLYQFLLPTMPATIPNEEQKSQNTRVKETLLFPVDSTPITAPITLSERNKPSLKKELDKNKETVLPLQHKEEIIIPGELSLITLKHHFTEILNKVKERKMSLYALFCEAVPYQVNQHHIQFSFRSGFHYHCERLNQTINRELIGQVVTEIFNQSATVEFIILGETIVPAAEKKATESTKNPIKEAVPKEIKKKKETTMNETNSDSLFNASELADIFGGKVL